MKKTLVKAAFAFLIASSAVSASASVMQTFGSGSAVSSATYSADFELNTSLATPYSEGGMLFTYNGSSNNNGCGYAGCGYHAGFYPGFSGNYMYTVGTGSFISIKRDNGADFFAVEFAAGSGFSGGINGYWETYNNGSLTGSGGFFTASVQVLGLSDSTGFDEVRYFAGSSANDHSFSAAAVDTVRASNGNGRNSVPEPASIALLGIGLFGIGAMRRKRRA